MDALRKQGKKMQFYFTGSRQQVCFFEQFDSGCTLWHYGCVMTQAKYIKILHSLHDNIAGQNWRHQKQLEPPAEHQADVPCRKSSQVCQIRTQYSTNRQSETNNLDRETHSWRRAKPKFLKGFQNKNWFCLFVCALQNIWGRVKIIGMAWGSQHYARFNTLLSYAQQQSCRSSLPPKLSSNCLRDTPQFSIKMAVIYGLLNIQTVILDYLREGFPWPARPFKHTEFNSFKHTVTTFNYTKWYFILPPGPHSLAHLPHI